MLLSYCFDYVVFPDELLQYNNREANDEQKFLSPPSTAQVVAVSNFSLSACSTVGGQSLAITKPHVYIQGSPRSRKVNGTEKEYEDVFTVKDLIPLVHESTSLDNVMDTTFPAEKYYISSTVIEKAGIPLNSVPIMMYRLSNIFLNNS